MTNYATLFSYLSALRKTHTRIHGCWTSLSNAQRARRRWTGLNEGGTVEDLDVRKELLRCGWQVVRDMGWFLDNLLAYAMMDVIDVEFGKLRDTLAIGGGKGILSGFPSSGSLQSVVSSRIPASGSTASNASTNHLDFTTLRTIHTTYLDRLLTGCLLTNPVLTSILLPIFEICERFVAQVERWGGDVLPALLFEGSLKGDKEVGAMVRERWGVVAEINEVRKPPILICSDDLNVTRHYIPFWNHSTSNYPCQPRSSPLRLQQVMHRNPFSSMLLWQIIQLSTPERGSTEG